MKDIILPCRSGSPSARPARPAGSGFSDFAVLCLTVLVSINASSPTYGRTTEGAIIDPSAQPPPPTVTPPGEIIDDFADLSKWIVVASDGVEGKISRVDAFTRPDGKSGPVLRLDFDFKKGSGYCIARRELDLPMPPNYRVGFWMLGNSNSVLTDGSKIGFVNDLEFKIYDQSGDDVWWVREAARAFRPSWEFVRYHRRQINFAWGPSGGRVPLNRASAIEFAVTACAVAPGVVNPNKRGYVLFDDITLETLPAPSTTPGQGVVLVNKDPQGRMLDGEAKDIVLTARDGIAQLGLDFGAPHEFGGLLIEWADKAPEVHSAVASSYLDGSFPRPLESMHAADQATMVLHPDPEASNATVAFRIAGEHADATIKRLRVLPYDAATNPNKRLALLASVSPRGWYPRSFLGEQVVWVPFGAQDSEFEGLISGDGQIETSIGGRTIEPFLWANNRLWTWADFNATSKLVDNRLPMPVVTLNAPGLPVTIEIQPFPIRESSSEGIAIRYRIQNASNGTEAGRLMLALRGIQALPPWHTLNLVGGTVAKRALAMNTNATEKSIRVGKTLLVGCSQPTATLLVEPNPHDIIAMVADGINSEPKMRGTGDSGALIYDYVIAPGNRVDFWVRSRVNETAFADKPVTVVEPSILESATSEVTANWRECLSRITLKLPPQARELEDSFYAQIGWILVNKDGPAIQPGSRTYDRTWIRDGALTATALLYTGHADEVKGFLDWFRTFQYEDGKIPCCVDERGPDPVPEHDSHGQYIYAVATYHRFTHDDDLLKRHWGNVAAAVGYIEKLRATRMTAEFSDPNAPAETRVKFGLMPESISHEGYSAKPMHSYWDDFFTLRGLTDAVYIAEKLGENETAAKWTTLRDDFQRTLVDSIRLAQNIKNIPYVPGCAELGDYDPTSTAAALFPGGQADGPLADSLRATFERYIAWFRDRRDGRIEWRDYTPYEMRNASALLLLGHADQSHEVLDWMLSERASIGWREWAEIGYKDKKKGQFVGDMPHTWVGSDYVKAVRNLCVHERERDHALVIGAGLKPQWLQDAAGVTVGGFPTEHGTLSYKASMTGGVITFDIEAGTIKVPQGGLVVMPMLDGGPVKSATINGKPAAETAPGQVIVRELPAKVEIIIQ